MQVGCAQGTHAARAGQLGRGCIAPVASGARWSHARGWHVGTGRVGLEPTTYGLTLPLRLSPPRRATCAPHVRGLDSVFTCARGSCRLPAAVRWRPSSLYTFRAPRSTAWLGVGISHRSPMLSAFTRTVSDAVLHGFTKSVALPVELPAPRSQRYRVPSPITMIAAPDARRPGASMHPACVRSAPWRPDGGRPGLPGELGRDDYWPAIVLPFAALAVVLPGVGAFSLLVSITNVTRRFCSAPGSSCDALGTSSRVLP